MGAPDDVEPYVEEKSKVCILHVGSTANDSKHVRLQKTIAEETLLMPASSPF